MIWLAAAAALVFLLPLVFVGLLRAPAPAFYMILMICSAGFIWRYARSSNLQWSESLKHGWALGTILSVFLGLAFISISGAPVSLNAMLHLGIAPVIWRGLLYGLVSGILISVIPFVVVWRALAGPNPGLMRRVGVTLVAGISISLMSLLFNLGMSGFNGRGIQNQVKMSVIVSAPTLISGSPLAAPLSNIFLQVSETAVSLEQARAADSEKLETAKSKSLPGGVD